MNDELTTRLSRQLHDQVDDWHHTPLTLTGVQGRARTIRRRRQALTTGVVAAAVLAVGIPVGLSLDARTDSSDVPVAPSPSRVVDSAVPGGGSEIGLPYLEDRILTLETGEELQLLETYTGGAVVDGTVYALSQDPDSLQNELSRLDDQGRADGAVRVTESGIVTNAARSAIAYVRSEDDRAVVVGASGEETELGDLGDYGAAQLVALVGGPDCAESAGSCTLWFNDGQGGAWVMDAAGEVTQAPGSPVEVTDVAPDGRVASVTDVDLTVGGACSAVAEPDGRRVFRTCDHTAGRFAPGGDHLSAHPAYQSGIGDTFVAILDAGGTEVARYEADRGDFVRSSTWEDAEHLLVTTYSYRDGWRVVRLGVDGSTETALGPDDGTGDARPAFTVLGTSS